jgi:hypothetical protein
MAAQSTLFADDHLTDSGTRQVLVPTNRSIEDFDSSAQPLSVLFCMFGVKLKSHQVCSLFLACAIYIYIAGFDRQAAFVRCFCSNYLFSVCEKAMVECNLHFIID